MTRTPLKGKIMRMAVGVLVPTILEIWSSPCMTRFEPLYSSNALAAKVSADLLCINYLFFFGQVQRVKNKWKITLKDGIVSVQGKDYLFHKCNG